jgi:MFS family permease
MSRFGGALINRDYARLWWGQAVSTVGDFVFDTTLVLWIVTRLGKGKPWAPAAVGGVMLAASVAILVVGPLAGVFVDRWNRRRTMLRTERYRAVLVGLLAAVAFLPTSAMPLGIWLTLIYATVFLVNVCGQFFGPARFATVTDVVTTEADRARAAGLGQSVQATAAMLGPPIAAPLLFTVGLQWALLLNALSYVFSYFAIRSVRLPDTSGGPRGADSNFRREFVEGLKMFGRVPILAKLLGLIMIAALGTGSINTLDVFFVTDNLRTNPNLYGFAAMAFGAGYILGAVSAGRIARWISAKQIVSWGLILTAVLFALYARQTSFAAALACTVALGIPVALLNVGVSPLLMAAIPKEYVGRVMAVINPGQEVASIMSTVIGAWLASTVLVGYHAEIGSLHIGRIDTIFTGAGVLLLLAGIYGLFALPKPQPKPSPSPSPSGIRQQRPSSQSK